LAKQSVVKYKARDGLEIEGLLISPLNASGPAPTLLTVHGGPESHYDDGWLTYYSLPGQVAAAKGYAVFYPNYRGSTGRGVEYAKSSQGDPAGKEFEDLIDAVDYLIEAGVTAKDKVGVTGGSYGGYATAWLTTRYTDRFAAGVMFVGISDKISKVGTTDIPDEEYLVHARKRPWDAWEFFAERSPIRYVEQARTPLLIMHGKEDPRVHPTQSMELFRFLKVLDQTPVRLVLYPGEGHGNRNAAARYDYNLRMLRWFDTYLMNSGAEKPEVEIDYQLPDSE
jgi:dipeptidyl aminopeptidase/acylaminoacyl peptidase